MALSIRAFEGLRAQNVRQETYLVVGSNCFSFLFHIVNGFFCCRLAAHQLFARDLLLFALLD